MSNQQITIIFIVVLVLVSLFLIFKSKNSATSTTLPKKSNTGSNIIHNVVSVVTPQSSFPLQQGKSGEQVKNLQQYLNDNYNAGLTVDGNFGPKTASALQANLNEVSMTEDEYNTIIGVDQYSSQFINGDTSNTNNPDPFAGSNVDVSANPCPWYLTVLGQC